MFHYCGPGKRTPGYGPARIPQKLEQNQKEAPVQIAGPLLPLQFTALEQGVRFKIDMSAGYSQGIFLDQRDHRRRVREKALRA